MAEVELTDLSLIVHIRGADRLFAMKSLLEVSLRHAQNAIAIHL